MITERGTILKINAANTVGKVEFSLSSYKAVKKISFDVTAPDGSQNYAFEFLCDGMTAAGEFIIENPIIWSYKSPNLYKYKATVIFDDETEIINGRFGFRTLSQNGKEICLNGTPVFVRGYIRGAKAHEHLNNTDLSEAEFYRKNIREAKKFGFNFVRFHSVVPDETYFNVADEEGILVHIELRQPTDEYDNISEMTDNGNMLMSDEYVREIAIKYFEHPSLCVYCIGNEIRNLAENERVDEIYGVIRSEDKTRLFLDTCAWGANGRKNVDIDVQHMSYYFPYGSHADMFENTENLLVVGSDENFPLSCEGLNSSCTRELYFNVPLIAHEVCHYTALRDYVALRDKFARYKVAEPWWIGEELKMIKEKGFEADYDKMYKASKFFQGECWKTAFEAIRRSYLLGGFHFLQFADTDAYENSNGVVDCFDDENVVSPEFFKRFNSDTVLLADLGRRIFVSDKQLVSEIYLSDYSEEKRGYADIVYELKDETDKIYASGRLKNVDVSKKGFRKIGKLHVTLPHTDESVRLTLKISLDENGSAIAENEWAIWVYRRGENISYARFTSYEENGAVITSDAEKALNALNDGKNVCLIYREDWTRHVKNKEKTKRPKYAFRASWNRFKPVIWDRGTNYGGIVDAELLNKYGFASGEFYDFNYGVISEDCDKIILDDFPAEVTSIVKGIDKSVRDRFDATKEMFNLPELMYDRTLRDFSYMFEVRVGGGKLLVCGFNLTGLDDNEPTSQRMAEFIKNYIKSEDFSPKHYISVEELRDYMKECAKEPIKERMMTQFWALDDAPVESKEFWRDSREYLIEK